MEYIVLCIVTSREDWMDGWMDGWMDLDDSFGRLGSTNRMNGMV
jgi:hypothetical protein